MGLAKARITVEHTKEVINVMYNPEEYTLNQENNFASQSVPGLQSQLLQFVHGNTRTLEMELFFDTYEAQTDVRDQTSKITELLNIDSELHAPPVLLVEWASLRFRCVLTRANQKFILFLPDGRPVRAKLTVSFSEYFDPQKESKETNRQTADFTKVHYVGEGETVSGIAFRYYDTPYSWRAIARANGIDDPREISTGQALLIPSLPYTDPDSRETID